MTDRPTLPTSFARRDRIIISLMLVVFTICFAVSCGDKLPESGIELKAEIQAPAINEFGIPADSLEENRYYVKRNQTFSDILLSHNVPYQTIAEIVDKSENIYDFRKINFGKEYAVYKPNGSNDLPSYFVYKPSELEYIVVRLIDSIDVRSGRKEIVLHENEMSGVIEYSLYETLSGKNIDINLALKLSEVFAWQIDFFSLQKGDYFKVIYEELYVDEKFFGIGRINAALFNHKGENYYAVYFKRPDQEDYFDEKDLSLRKEFLKAPLKFSRISSRFSRSRFHPILKRYRPHLGIDYAAPAGTPVQAVGDGVVIKRQYQKGGAGRFIKIRHNSTYESAYMHLSRYAKGVNVGDRVRQGQIIGYVGSSGLSTGPHLDFRFWKNGSPVNYLNQKFPPTNPVKEKYRGEYGNLKDYYIRRLEGIADEVRVAGAD